MEEKPLKFCLPRSKENIYSFRSEIISVEFSFRKRNSYKPNEQEEAI